LSTLIALFLAFSADSSSVAPAASVLPMNKDSLPSSVQSPTLGFRFQEGWIQAQFGLRSGDETGAGFLIGGGVKSDVEIRDDGGIRYRSARKGMTFQVGVERSYAVVGPLSCHWQLGLGYEHLVAAQGLDSSGIDSVRNRSLSKLDPSTGNYVLIHYSPLNSTRTDDWLDLNLRLGARIRLSNTLRLVGEVEAGPRFAPDKSLSNGVDLRSPSWLLGLDAFF